MSENTWPALKTAFAIPLALLVLSDYAILLVWWARVLLCGYILLQAAGLVAGLVLGMYKLTEKDNKWVGILDYRIAKYFPTILLGAEVFAWAMSKESEESESESPEPEIQETLEQQALPC